MKPYKSVQSSWWMYIFPLIILFLIAAYYFQWGNNPITLAPMLIISGLFILIFALFYKFEVEVNEGQIDIRYGVGWISFKVPLQDVKSVELVKNPWYYGFGIKVIPNGMLYNIKGLDAVELTYNNRKKIVRIGARSLEGLKEAIEAQIKK